MNGRENYINMQGNQMPMMTDPNRAFCLIPMNFAFMPQQNQMFNFPNYQMPQNPMANLMPNFTGNENVVNIIPGLNYFNNPPALYSFGYPNFNPLMMPYSHQTQIEQNPLEQIRQNNNDILQKSKLSEEDSGLNTSQKIGKKCRNSSLSNEENNSSSKDAMISQLQKKITKRQKRTFRQKNKKQRKISIKKRQIRMRSSNRFKI